MSTENPQQTPDKPRFNLRSIQKAGNREISHTTKPIPLRTIEHAQALALSHTASYKNIVPTLQPEQAESVIEVGSIHRQFIADITRKGFDQILFTGSSADVVKDTVLVAAYLERKSQSGDQPINPRLPEMSDWPSSRYYQRETSGPNAIVYKNLSETTITNAITNVRNAREIPKLTLEFDQQFGHPPSEETEAVEFTKAKIDVTRQLITEFSTPTLDPSIGFDKKFMLLALMRSSSQTELDQIAIGFSKEQMSNISGCLHYVKDEVDTAGAVYRHNADELDTLEASINTTHTSLKDGRYRKFPPNKYSILGGEETFDISKGSIRVDLMKALCPEVIPSLYKTGKDGAPVPKKIAIYDTVIDTGTKIKGYKDFFDALGISSNVEVYSVFASPSYRPVFSFETHIGKRTTFTGDPEDMALLGKEWDKKSKFASLSIQEKDRPGTASELVQYQAARFNAIMEQFMVGEKLDQYVSIARECYNASQAQENPQKAKFLAEYFSHDPPTSILIHSYKEFPPSRYRDFEGHPYLPEHKFFQDLHLWLSDLNGRLQPNSFRLIVDSETNLIALIALLKTGRYPNLTDADVIELGFFSNLGELPPTDKKTIVVGESHPSAGFIKGMDPSSDLEVYAVFDKRPQFTPEKRALAWEEAKRSTYETEYCPKGLRSDQPKLDLLIQTLKGKDYDELLSNIYDTLALESPENLSRMLESLRQLNSSEPLPQALQILPDLQTKNLPRAELRQLLSVEAISELSQYLEHTFSSVKTEIDEAAEWFSWKPDFSSRDITTIGSDYAEWQSLGQKYHTHLIALHDTLIFGKAIFQRQFSTIYPYYSLEQSAAAFDKFRTATKPSVESDYEGEFCPNVSTISRDPRSNKTVFIGTRLYKPPKTKEALEFITEMEKIRYLADIVAIEPVSVATST